MKKSLLVILLILCLLVGFLTTKTADNNNEAAAVLPLTSDFPAVCELPLLTPLPENQAGSAPLNQEMSEPGDESPVPAWAAAPIVRSETLDRIFSENPALHGTVLIARKGEILLYKAYGLSDAEKGTKNTIHTKFIIGSITKQFTAMAIMQLYARGLLDLHDTLSKYIPDFPRGGDITLLDLLTQTSGIIDYYNDEPPLISTIPFEKLSQSYLIEQLKASPLKFEPGEKYSYSNSNYLILSYIIEKVSGMGYGDYLSRYIFEPLGMKNTGVYDINDPPADMAAGHVDNETPIRYAIGGDDEEYAKSAAAGYGAGGMYSTVGDLYLWDEALSTQTLLPKEYMEMIFKPSVPVPGPVIPCAYGYGWVIENDPDCGTVYRHTGSLAGFRAYNGLFPDKDITVITLFNHRSFAGREQIIPALKEVFKAM